jgi:hypothetical protein
MKTRDDRLGLHEAVLLLALRDQEGTNVPGTMYQYAVGGAIAAELLLEGRLALDPEKKKNWVRVVSTTPSGDAVLDEALGAVASAKRRSTLETWIGKFAGMKRLKHKIAERLCGAGILRADEDRVLGIFNRKIYPEADPRPERQLVQEIRKAVITDARDVAPRTVVLVALMRHSGLLKAVFTRAEIKARKARIEQVTSADAVGKATKNAIEAVQAAIFAAAIIPAICATH